MEGHAGFKLPGTAGLEAGYHATAGPARRKADADQVTAMVSMVIDQASAVGYIFPGLIDLSCGGAWITGAFSPAMYWLCPPRDGWR